MHRAEQAFDRRNPAEDPDWINYFDSFELAGEAAHCFRDLGKSEETQRFAQQALDPVATPPRTRAFIDMVSAEGALSGGNLDEAVSLATAAVSLAGSLQSERYIKYLTDFYQSLSSKHAGHPLVRDFADFVQESHPRLIIPHVA